MRDEKFIYIKSMVVDGILFTNMLAVIGKPGDGGLEECGNNYFIMPLFHESIRVHLGLHNNNNETCILMPSLKLGRYSVKEDSDKWTDKNYVVLKNISSILRVEL